MNGISFTTSPRVVHVLYEGFNQINKRNVHFWDIDNDVLGRTYLNDNSINRTSFIQIEDLAIDKPTGMENENINHCINEYMEKNNFDIINLNNYSYNKSVCEHCKIGELIKVNHEGIIVCNHCFTNHKYLVDNDKPTYKEPPKEVSFYAYKRINHFREILSQFQAKESTIIPNEVMNEVVLEIKKRRIQNVAELTEKDMREILKKLNRSKYYEHATHIISRLNGNPPPTITPEIEEKIRAMFQEIQAPFLIYCPDDRTNFLSYSYILYKFFELLELDEYKVYFPLLKSRDRLISHDAIWEKICSYFKWEFIRSV
jgi:hypothetical protein